MEENKRKNMKAPGNDEIPYEVRMKHLIEAYRKDIKRLEELTKYAKGLEEENLLLQKKIEKYEEQMKDDADKASTIRQMDLEIRQLKGTLTKTFPKRVMALKKLKRKLENLEEYVGYLQSVLLDNDIPYEERKPNPSEEVEGISAKEIDIFAVRGDNEDFETETLTQQ